MLVIGLGPEQAGQPLAGRAPLAGRGQHGQQRKAGRPEPRSDRRIIALQGQPAEGQETQHVRESVRAGKGGVKQEVL